jgi:glucosamine 6-phosphate synthetase-like amidotransferase/phosphosugar isomerase protein
LDFGGTLAAAEKELLYRRLAAVSEVRGEHAGGAAWPDGAGGVAIVKEPGPITQARFLPEFSADMLMGHCRYSTLRNEGNNANNHPFQGAASGGMPYALAHNGILADLAPLRRAYGLHAPGGIETDSYIAVQMLGLEAAVDISSLSRLGGLLRGSFSFSVLDGGGNLYFLRGDVPVFLLRHIRRGFFVYASTRDIFEEALLDTAFGRDYILSNIDAAEGSGSAMQKITLEKGDVLRIGPDGEMRRARFAFDESRAISHNWYRHNIEGNAEAERQLRELNN